MLVDKMNCLKDERDAETKKQHGLYAEFDKLTEEKKALDAKLAELDTKIADSRSRYFDLTDEMLELSRQVYDDFRQQERFKNSPSEEVRKAFETEYRVRMPEI